MDINDGMWVDGELVIINCTNVDNTPVWIDGELRPIYQHVAGGEGVTIFMLID